MPFDFSCQIIEILPAEWFLQMDFVANVHVCIGELKMNLSMVTSLEPKAQRLLFRGKEREDADFLHMVGVKHMDKVLLLEDPANKERKLNALARNQAIGNPCYTIRV